MARRPKTATLDLALQAGGSQGAFTWGVLDRLLDDTTLRFTGISGPGTSTLSRIASATLSRSASW